MRAQGWLCAGMARVLSPMAWQVLSAGTAVKLCLLLRAGQQPAAAPQRVAPCFPVSIIAKHAAGAHYYITSQQIFHTPPPRLAALRQYPRCTRTLTAWPSCCPRTAPGCWRGRCRRLVLIAFVIR